MRKALLVGIDDYPSSPLYGCVADATAMEEQLARHFDGSLNFATRLYTSAPQLTKSFLREAIYTLFQGDPEVALLYFSGHGLLTVNGGYIVTPDYRRYDEGISMDEILGVANQSGARDKVIILDCCHSGAFGSPSLTGGTASMLGNGLTVLTACRSSEYAIEFQGRGLFTSLLTDALQGGAADLRGNITPGSLYAYVDEALGAWEQRPIFKTNISKSVVIKRAEPPIAVDVLRKLTTYFPQGDQELRLDPSYEFTSAQADPDKVKVFKDLQKLVSARLVKPVGEDHMYFAALNSKSCRLTALGYQYWRLGAEGKL